MLRCHECFSVQISVWGELWVDFYEGGHREVDEQELEEFEPKFGDWMLCRAMRFQLELWTSFVKSTADAKPLGLYSNR